ncbi:MAG: alanine racemase [Syntrophomonadaceae bacterium]|nr:alanine racemase [Syntrophomonadaceae bacterium]
MDNKRPTWAEIDLKAIHHNLQTIRKAAVPARVMAIVKANAYGHGVHEVAKACLQEGVEHLGVATLDEALAVRRDGVAVPILILGPVGKEHAQTAVDWNLRITVFDLAMAQALSDAAIKSSKSAYVHIKLDTGMGRVGFPPNTETVEQIVNISRLPGIKLEGIFTHFASADKEDKSKSLKQLQLFNDLIAEIEKQKVDIPLKHCSNSAALIDLPEARFNMVRAGIILYGLYPSPYIRQELFKVIPAMTLKSKISFLKKLATGATVSYGCTWQCNRETTVATVPIGYADGYRRLLSNKAFAAVRGQRVPLIGTVCMDQCMFDVTEVEGVSEGDEIILFGKSEDLVTADELAEIEGTINYEIVCAVSSRVPRIYIS